MDAKSRIYVSTLTTSKTDVYTAPDRFESEIKSLLISNITSTPATVSLDYFKFKTTTTTPFIKDLRIESNSIVQIDNFFHLEVKDKIQAAANLAATITLSFLVEETNANALGL